MLPPGFFMEARQMAEHFVQARVLDWDGRLSVRVTQVFRGGLRRGDRLSLTVNIASDRSLQLGDPTLWSRLGAVRSARFLEAFLSGEPPDVVCDQIKYLRHGWWRPSGDPTTEAFLW